VTFIPLTRDQALMARGIDDYERRPLTKTQTRHVKPGSVCTHWLGHRVTCDEYDDMSARAAGHCEICRKPATEEWGHQLVVDHFDGPGLNIVRGLLCRRCNSVMACMDGNKNWGVPTWSLRDRALIYLANSWDTPTLEQWPALIAEVERRLLRRKYKPNVPADLLERYRIPWPTLLIPTALLKISKLSIDMTVSVSYATE
jgi:hypothetical protein